MRTDEPRRLRHRVVDGSSHFASRVMSHSRYKGGKLRAHGETGIDLVRRGTSVRRQALTKWRPDMQRARRAQCRVLAGQVLRELNPLVWQLCYSGDRVGSSASLWDVAAVTDPLCTQWRLEVPVCGSVGGRGIRLERSRARQVVLRCYRLRCTPEKCQVNIRKCQRKGAKQPGNEMRE